jgi:hypothetical protein
MNGTSDANYLGSMTCVRARVRRVLALVWLGDDIIMGIPHICGLDIWLGIPPQCQGHLCAEIYIRLHKIIQHSKNK